MKNLNRLLATSVAALFIASAAPSFAGTHVNFDFGVVDMGFSDGYWDHDHHWHRWHNHHDRDFYRAKYGDHYRHHRHDRDSDEHWHH